MVVTAVVVMPAAVAVGVAAVVMAVAAAGCSSLAACSETTASPSAQRSEGLRCYQPSKAFLQRLRI